VLSRLVRNRRGHADGRDGDAERDETSAEEAPRVLTSWTQALHIARDTQIRHDPTGPSRQKRAAKEQAARLIREYGTVRKGSRYLDLGGEDWYDPFFDGFVLSVNLPDGDMHDLARYGGGWDCVLAMHSLEHSPAPLVVLLEAYDVLRPKGVLYVATPQPCQDFVNMESHWTVLHWQGWYRLIRAAGFDILHVEKAVFGDYDDAIEDRFVCRRP